MAYNIFISYSTKDMKVVNIVKNILKAPNIELFVSEYSVEPGEDLDQEIIKNIQDCDMFLLLWSGNTKQSKYVEKELWMARGIKKLVVPLVLKKRLKLPDHVKNLKYIPVYRNPNEHLSKLRIFIQNKASQKSKKELGVVLLAISALIGGLYLMSNE